MPLSVGRESRLKRRDGLLQSLGGSLHGDRPWQGADVDDEIPVAAPLSPAEPERFSERPLNPIANHRRPNSSRDDDGDSASRGRGRGETMNNVRASFNPPALANDASNVGARAEVRPLGQAAPHGPPSPPPRQTARRLRPLARRRLSVRRPPGVRMRARKPWVRLRLTTLGWYVRFTRLPCGLKP